MQEVVGLDTGRETVESSKDEDGLELDLVTHDARKFFGLLLKKNGYVLEQLYSPLVVHTTPEHEELKAIAKGCITRHHSHHYFGFADTQWRLFEKEAAAGQATALRVPGAADGHPSDVGGGWSPVVAARRWSFPIATSGPTTEAG